MATFYQWKRSPKKRQTTMIVAGPDMGLAEMVVDTAVEIYDTSSIWWFDAAIDAQREIVETLYTESVFGPRAIVVKNIEEITDWRPFTFFSKKPTTNTMLVLVAPSRFKEGTTRWIPSTDAVLYVDCAFQEEPTLLLIAQSFRLDEPLAQEVVNRFGADSRMLINEASKLAAARITSLELAKSSCALPPPPMKSNAAIDLITIGSPLPVEATQKLSMLEMRIRQCLSLKLALSGVRRPIKDIAEDAKIPIFLVPKLMPFVKDSQTSDWVRRLNITIASIIYARQGATIGSFERVVALW